MFARLQESLSKMGQDDLPCVTPGCLGAGNASEVSKAFVGDGTGARTHPVPSPSKTLEASLALPAPGFPASRKAGPQTWW